MEVTAWNNGSPSSSGAGYGLKIKKKDRDKFFKKEWKFVILHLQGEQQSIEVNIDKESFWNKCSELIKKEIGIWLLKNGFASWPKGNPTKFQLQQIEGNHFSVTF